MADMITLADGSNEILFELKDMLELIDTHLGDEARKWLEQYLTEIDDLGGYATCLEEEIQGQKDHHRDVMERLRTESEIIARLIREKEIDRIKLSAAVGQIGIFTGRELSVR